MDSKVVTAKPMAMADSRKKNGSQAGLPERRDLVAGDDHQGPQGGLVHGGQQDAHRGDDRQPALQASPVSTALALPG